MSPFHAFKCLPERNLSPVKHILLEKCILFRITLTFCKQSMKGKTISFSQSKSSVPVNVLDVWDCEVALADMYLHSMVLDRGKLLK